MAKGNWILQIRLTPHERWLISQLKPETALQTLSDRARNVLLEAARSQSGKTTSDAPKGCEPRKWPVIE